MSLSEYISAHVTSGEQIDMIFFKLDIINEPDSEILRSLIIEQKGCFCEVDLFDGKEHSYIELGSWIGDQGQALNLMGLGSALGLWKLLTPRSLMPFLEEDLIQQMAGQGMVTIQAELKNRPALRGSESSTKQDGYGMEPEPSDVRLDLGCDRKNRPAESHEDDQQGDPK